MADVGSSSDDESYNLGPAMDRDQELRLLAIVDRDDAPELRREVAAAPEILREFLGGGDGGGGSTLLHIAARNNKIECFRALIELGADVNAVSAHGSNTPLHSACRNGHASCADALCKAGAKLDVLDSHEKSPFCGAVEAVMITNVRKDTGRRRVIQILLRAGVQPHFPSFEEFLQIPRSVAWILAKAVERAGGWPAYVLNHKRILVGLVTKCRPVPADVAGLIVDFWTPPGGF